MLPLHEPYSPLTAQRRSQPFAAAPLNQTFDRSIGKPAEPISQVDFSDLTEFQPVQDHYHHLGIQFSGAIAVSPSNPAFGVRGAKLVLMPQAGRSSISVQFHSLQRFIGAYVTAAQQIKLTLFNSQNQPIGEQTAGNIRYVASMTSVPSFPTYQLELLSENIAKAEFCSQAPFVLSYLFWG